MQLCGATPLLTQFLAGPPKRPDNNKTFRGLFWSASPAKVLLIRDIACNVKASQNLEQ